MRQWVKWVKLKMEYSTLPQWHSANASRIDKKYNAVINEEEIKEYDGLPSIKYEEEAIDGINWKVTLKAIVPKEIVTKIKDLWKQYLHDRSIDDIEFLQSLLMAIVEYDETPSYDLHNEGGDYGYTKIYINKYFLENQ